MRYSLITETFFPLNENKIGDIVVEITSFFTSLTRPPPYVKPKSTKKDSEAWIVVLVVSLAVGFLLIIIALSSFTSSPSILSSGPRPEVVGIYGKEGFEGLNYVFYVYVTVENKGDDGLVTVYAEVYTSDYYERKHQTIYMKHGERTTLTFTFDISALGAMVSGIRYRAWAVPGD